MLNGNTRTSKSVYPHNFYTFDAQSGQLNSFAEQIFNYYGVSQTTTRANCFSLTGKMKFRIAARCVITLAKVAEVVDIRVLDRE